MRVGLMAENLLNLLVTMRYFALTSESGLWSFDEMRSWQVDAGLVPRRSM